MNDQSGGLPKDGHGKQYNKTIFDELDSIKAKKNFVVKREMTADALIAKHRSEIEAIHRSGRGQFEVFLLIELREGRLEHTEDTLRKSVNKIIRNWRDKPASDGGQSVTKVASKNTAPFADLANKGGEQW